MTIIIYGLLLSAIGYLNFRTAKLSHRIAELEYILKEAENERDTLDMWCREYWGNRGCPDHHLQLKSVREIIAYQRSEGIQLGG
jgi:hypothetical protein